MIPEKGSHEKMGHGQLKKLLDHFFSVWIRRRWADSSGMVSCVTCGARKHWKEMECGHYLSRVHTAIRWDERNAAPQCSVCNQVLHGSLGKYTDWMKQKYGSQILQQLRECKNLIMRFHRSELRRMIDEYKGRITDLDNGGDGSPRGQEVGHGALRLHGAASNDLR
jgi:hypothetical protein